MSLRAALHGGNPPLAPPQRMSGRGLRWGTPEALTGTAPSYPAAPWSWSGPARRVRGRTWGGNVEILSWVLGVSRWVPQPTDLTGGVLLLVQSGLSDPGRTVDHLREAGLKAAVTRRRRIAFGPVVNGRAHWLRQRGLLPLGETEEELVVVRAELPV